MVKLSFNDPTGWSRIYALRSQAPPAREDDLYGWIHTQHVRSWFEPQVEAALNRVARHHAGTNESWLAISGPAHVGKTSAITSVLLERARQDAVPWASRRKSGYLYLPYVYVEAASRQEAKGLMASIARFCGLPDSGNEKVLHLTLTAALPELGVKAIVVDEAHMFRRSNENASRTTDGLRNMLHLPVPLVFVGVDLERSALLRYTSRNNDTSSQMHRRHTSLPLRAVSGGDYLRLARLTGRFKERMSAIEGMDLSGLSDSDEAARAMSHVFTAAEGRPGTLLTTLKRAAVEAIATNDRVLTADLLVAEAAAVGGQLPPPKS